MKRMSMAVFVFLFLFVVLAGSASAFRCGARLISIGDRRADVLQKCGSPTWVDSWEEDRVERTFESPYWAPGPNGPIPYGGTRIPLYRVVRITVEEWTYNLGRTQFIRILRFENSRVVDIQTGDYGY